MLLFLLRVGFGFLRSIRQIEVVDSRLDGLGLFGDSIVVVAEKPVGKVVLIVGGTGSAGGRRRLNRRRLVGGRNGRRLRGWRRRLGDRLNRSRRSDWRWLRYRLDRSGGGDWRRLRVRGLRRRLNRSRGSDRRGLRGRWLRYRLDRSGLYGRDHVFRHNASDKIGDWVGLDGRVGDNNHLKFKGPNSQTIAVLKLLFDADAFPVDINAVFASKIAHCDVGRLD